MISVVIPLYNKELSISKMLTSVLNQKFKNFEVLIINDGSTDKSVDIINQNFTDERIKIINKINGGVSSARNLGIKEAKYDWVALIDADDCWTENHLLNFYNCINTNSEINVCSSGYAKVDKHGTFLNKYHVKKSGLYDFFEVSLEINFATNSSSIIFNKKRFPNTFFNENISKGEDTRVWEILGKQEKFYFFSEITSLYHVEAENSAIGRNHDLAHTHIYNLDLNSIENNIQKKYYQRLICHTILLGFLGHEKLNDIWKLYKKYFLFLGMKGPINFFVHAIKTKIKN